MPTRDECIDAAGQALAFSQMAIAQMTPREQAEAAWHPGAPFSVDELEDLIRLGRGLPSAHLEGAELQDLLDRDHHLRLTRRGVGGPTRRRAVVDDESEGHLG
ncbi:hypothetical protein NPS01_22520 [Nocardioides psychrotolerans]|uniref:Uncharacterized protein n=1 Tax=Nocardioides psychrotolerans TaxID=1005945 RepID=A0A1I3I6B5_9ACTN|nr:hypothetical protein [Nocardioides psychrotolerans]GEP38589.1 hypothetical protein NPS01_22520 [Nocardioides psychrotolerans]SFI43407.1 hypothetical protein SAMN05216561_108132 [Nocardioides psychrotolerans]